MTARGLLLLAALLPATSAGAAAQHGAFGRPTVTATRVADEPVIDGRLDEAAWQQAGVLDGFHQKEPVDGRPAEERTEVRVLYGARAIFFGVRAWDSQPGTIHATLADRDKLAAEDSVTIYLDTFNDRRRAFFFTVNPLGAQEDGVLSEAGANAGELDGGQSDRNPDFLFESRGRLLPDGWEAELRIPFKSLRYPGGTGPQVWGLNVSRYVPRSGYVDTWTDVRRGSASFLAQAGLLEGLSDLESGRVFEAQPFVTAIREGLRGAGGAFEPGSLHVEGGFNLRLGLASDVSLDATVNPDFSQVESDVAQVTINERFALFFPEKRPFFLEGIELFSSPHRLIYTRRVVEPLFGAKLTLKRGGMNVGHLTSVDRGLRPGSPDALLTATHLRRDVGRHSTAGLTFTHRRQGDQRNTVAAADGRWLFGKLYFLQAEAGASFTRDLRGQPTASAPVWLVEFDRTGRTWGFNYKVDAVGAGFRADAGYVPRTNVVEATASNRLSFYGERGRVLESFSIYHGLTRRFLHADFRLGQAEESENTLLGILRLRGGWEVWAQGTLNSYRLDPQSFEGLEVAGPAGLQPFAPPESVPELWSFLGRVGLPTWRSIGGSLQVYAGEVPIFQEGARGHELRATLSADLRPTASLRVGLSLVLSQIDRALDGSEFARTVLPRIKLEYQPTRALFFRLVGDYRSLRSSPARAPLTGEPLFAGGEPLPGWASNEFRVDALLSYEPGPGTVGFIGYGTSLDNGARLGFSDLRRSSDGFFFKVAHRFRR